MKLDPAKMKTGERYRILTGAVTPRPIALVSSCDAAGRVNLAPFSFFNGVSASPMAVVFSPVTKNDGSDKDTLRNVLPKDEGGTGEFVLNLAVEAYAQKMAGCAEDLPPGESEFELVGLTAAPSEVVAPPRVAQSPIAFECRTLQVIRLAPGVPLSGNLVIGEVVFMHVRDDLLDAAHHIDQAKLGTLGRMGGPTYCRTTDLFDLPRGRPALAARLPFAPKP